MLTYFLNDSVEIIVIFPKVYTPSQCVLLLFAPSDVNDNVPFFLSSTYEATVPEGAEVGTSVAQVSASDLDSGLHGEVRST